MPPQPYLLAEQTALQEVDHSLLHAAQQGVVGHAVEGQHVYEYALVHVYVLEERLRKHGAVLAHLGEIVWRMGVGVLPRQEVALPELGRSYAQEAVVCVACHPYVHVIVPRQYGVVVECAYGCAAYEEVGYAVLAAHTHRLAEDVV